MACHSVTRRQEIVNYNQQSGGSMWTRLLPDYFIRSVVFQIGRVNWKSFGKGKHFRYFSARGKEDTENEYPIRVKVIRKN